MNRLSMGHCFGFNFDVGTLESIMMAGSIGSGTLGAETHALPTIPGNL